MVARFLAHFLAQVQGKVFVCQVNDKGERQPTECLFALRTPGLLNEKHSAKLYNSNAFSPGQRFWQSKYDEGGDPVKPRVQAMLEVEMEEFRDNALKAKGAGGAGGAGD